MAQHGAYTYKLHGGLGALLRHRGWQPAIRQRQHCAPLGGAPPQPTRPRQGGDAEERVIGARRQRDLRRRDRLQAGLQHQGGRRSLAALLLGSGARTGAPAQLQSLAASKPVSWWCCLGCEAWMPGNAGEPQTVPHALTNGLHSCEMPFGVQLIRLNTNRPQFGYVQLSVRQKIMRLGCMPATRLRSC